MKNLLIAIIVIILLIFGYNKYQDYQRFNGPDTNYISSNKIDHNYHDRSTLLNYQNAIAQLNGFINTQWSAHRIDVLNPEDDDKQTKYAVNSYAEKLAQVRHYENTLEQSTLLKEKGISNSDIKLFEQTGLIQVAYQALQKKKKYHQLIKNSFTNQKLRIGEKSSLVFEIQKLLAKNGFPVTNDGIYRNETINALKAFETKHNLLPDGKLDAISLDYLLESY